MDMSSFYEVITRQEVVDDDVTLVLCQREMTGPTESSAKRARQQVSIVTNQAAPSQSHVMEVMPTEGHPSFKCEKCRLIYVSDRIV
ncbi:hypothetical protein J6590_016884 [Homalodisca vitripennis]|nr:hypothetical protein J6590_016884 [Homalodisca vitripennis]